MSNLGRLHENGKVVNTVDWSAGSFTFNGSQNFTGEFTATIELKNFSHTLRSPSSPAKLISGTAMIGLLDITKIYLEKFVNG
jgi:hypothetical protein